MQFNYRLPRLILKLNGTKYGRSLRLGGWPFIYRSAKSKIEIGDNVSINSNFFSNLLGIYQRTIIVANKQCVIKIGDRVGISGSTIYGWNSIEIGDDTRIGVNCKIIDTDFHPINPEDRRLRVSETVGCKPIKIGKNVFIGMNSLILKGTVLGDNCVVGAGSVVSGTFEPNCIIAGNPARVIRKIDDSDELKKENQ